VTVCAVHLRLDPILGKTLAGHVPGAVRAASYLEPLRRDPKLSPFLRETELELTTESVERVAAELAEWRANTPAEQLKKILVGLAIEADVILDLHCDAEAVMHLYTLTPSAEAFQPLCSLLGCQAILLAAESGGNPFDEVSSRPWLDLRQAFPDHPIPDGCIACTVELRGERDVDRGTALADAAALVDYMIVLGVIEGQKPAIPEPLCRPTPLEGSEPVTAPAGGIVVFHAKPGDRVAAGDVIAEIIDPLTGATVAARTASDGVLYARIGTRFARAGERLAKVAGTTLHRSGKLLSA